MNGTASRNSIPPYGHELLRARRQGVSLNVFVHAGDRSWDRARMRAPPHVLCLPPDESFRAYDWSAVKGLELTLVVWNRPPEQVDSFARHLVSCGAKLVASLGASVDDQGKVAIACPLFYRPAHRVAVA